MSQLPIRSSKHCAKYGMKVEKSYKKIFYIFSTILLFILSIIFIVWLIIRPSKPDFYLKKTDIFQLKLSGPHLLNSSIQISLVSMNPNKRVGVYYDELQVCAFYKGQQITLEASLPSFYQGHENSNLLSASLTGNWVPVAPSFDYEVSKDQLAGKLLLGLKLNGRLRWKVGSWVSSHYHINVDCFAVMVLGQKGVTGPLSSKQGTHCPTTV